ncbi:MAG: S8 family serine peptidase [Anaerolineae bacterium]
MRRQKGLLRVLPLVCLAVALPIGVILAGPPQPAASPLPAGNADQIPVIIQLAGEPAALYQARAFGVTPLDATASTQVRDHTARLRTDQARFLRAAREQGIDLLVRHRYTYVFNGLAILVNVTDLPALASLPGLKTVHLDREVHAYLSDSVPLIGAPAVWDMTDPDGQPVTGTGIRVAIVDTGIDYTHPDLGGCIGPGCKVIDGYDFINDDADPFDDNGHGTHVAGTVAANGTLKGVAPDAQLLGVKVLSAQGAGLASGIVAGIEWATDPDGDPATDDGAHVINMSLGGAGDPGDPSSQAVDAASALGIVVAVAAGNAGPGHHTLGSPGVAHSAVTVCATDKSDAIARFSSRGPVMNSFALKPDLCAPGVEITSTVPLTGPTSDPSRYKAIGGTSMASPHVAGVAALLRQLHPDWSPAIVKAAMMQTAQPVLIETMRVPGEPQQSQGSNRAQVEQWGLNPYVQGSGRVRADQAALNRAVILPASLSLGADDLTQPQWSRSEVLALTNLTTHTLTYTLSVTGTLPAGVNTMLNPSQLTVGPGETRNFNFLLTVDNGAVPNVKEAPYAYTGQILAMPTDRALALRVPFAFVKSPLLKARLEDGIAGIGAFAILVHDRADFQTLLSPVPESLTLALPSGAYDLVALFAPTEDMPGWRFVVREQVQVGTVTEVTLRGSAARNAVTLVTEDEQGQFITTTTSVGVLTYQPSPAGIFLTPPLPIGTTWYLSDVGTDYRFDAAAVRTVPAEGGFYSFFGQSVGVTETVEFQPDATAYRRVSHPLHLPASQGTVALSEMRFPLVSIFDILFFQSGVLTTTLPYVRQAHYMAAPSADFATGYLWRAVMTLEDELVLQPAPLRREPDGLLWGYPPVFHPIAGLFGFGGPPTPPPLFATDAGVIPLGLDPPHWFARFTNTETEIELRPAVGDALYLFATQWSDMLPSNNLPYTLRRDGELVEEGQFPDAWGAFGALVVTTTIPISVAGHYSLTVPFTYTLGISEEVEGHANVIADFDTQRADPDPPAIVNLWLLAGGTPTDEPYGPPEVRVTLTDTVRVAGTSLAFNAGAGWTIVPLTPAGDEHRGVVPAQTPGTRVALRLRAWDTAGNELIYELEPAYVQAPYRMRLPLITKNAVAP